MTSGAFSNAARWRMLMWAYWVERSSPQTFLRRALAYRRAIVGELASDSTAPAEALS